jgi:hypothetical protein
MKYVMPAALRDKQQFVRGASNCRTPAVRCLQMANSQGLNRAKSSVLALRLPPPEASAP